jgi:hypothetical protein
MKTDECGLSVLRTVSWPAILAVRKSTSHSSHLQGVSGVLRLFVPLSHPFTLP